MGHRDFPRPDPGHRAAIPATGLPEALQWLQPVRHEYELQVLVIEGAGVGATQGVINRLWSIETTCKLSSHLCQEDLDFLQEVALQMALWDTSSDGLGTWRSWAADDLVRGLRSVRH